jgi:hypothetical protein
MIMKPQTRQTHHPTAHGSGTDWQVLGELELPPGVEARARINTWLLDVLTSLHLPVDFLKKVLKSAEDAVGRSVQTEVVMACRHIHLLIYVPANRPLNAQTWGFFRIEKAATSAESEHTRAHVIELYLFLEG